MCIVISKIVSSTYVLKFCAPLLQRKIETFFLVRENRKKYPRVRTLVSPLLSLSESLYKILVLPISQHHTLFYQKYYFLFCVLEILYRNTSFIHSFIQGQGRQGSPLSPG